MLTQCPQCNTLFRITAEQLKAARGQVRCSICFSTFDAIDNFQEEGNLTNREKAAPRRELSGLSTKNIGALPEWTMPGAPVKEKGNEAKVSSPVPAPTESEEFFPESQDEAMPADHWSVLAWRISGACLLIGLLAQVIWFHGDTLVDQYPSTRFVLEGACKHWGCGWMNRRDLQAVRLLSQDMRQHPRYQKTLLVNAIMVNEASFNQPYPVLQLSLYNTSGTMVAARRFEPSEYLDGGISTEIGMQPSQPVHVVLEVAEPRNEGVVSYEFGFL